MTELATLVAELAELEDKQLTLHNKHLRAHKNWRDAYHDKVEKQNEMSLYIQRLIASG
jgi:hypothetical protein